MKLKWYLSTDPDSGPTDLWLCDEPMLSVYFDVRRGWVWVEWDDDSDPAGGGEGFKTARKAKEAAEQAVTKEVSS